GRSILRRFTGSLSKLLLPDRALTHNDKWCPKRRIGIEGIAGVIHVGDHGPPECLGASNVGVALQYLECCRGQSCGRIGIDRPMRYQKRIRAAVEEAPREPRQSLPPH